MASFYIFVGMIKKLFAVFFLSALSLLAVNAKVYTVESLPVIKTGEKKFVCNPDHILSPAVADSMCRMFQHLEDSVHVQVLVVAVDSFSPADDYRFAEDLANYYGVGKKGMNSGLVILVSRGYRCARFVTGEGLEGDLPDAICKRIWLKMIPYLRISDWDGGTMVGANAVYSLLIGTNSFSGYEDEGEDFDLDSQTIFFLFLFLVLPILVGIYSSRRAKRCPYCKKQMKVTKTDRYRNGYKETVITHMLCPNCGRTHSRKSIIDHTPSRSSGGIFIGGGGGGSFGGGSGFGGGSFGGGGAGGRF